MRTSGLLVILLCGLLSVCAASDAMQQASSTQASATPFPSEWLNPSESAHDFIALPVSNRGDQDDLAFKSPRDGDATCYTIQNFLVKREPHSDVTKPYGYSTCLPSSKYRMKIVEEPQEASSR